MSRAGIALLWVLGGSAGCGRAPEPIQLFVAASVSDLAAAWQARPGDAPAFEYHAGASVTLANQILAGAHADLLLAAGLQVVRPLVDRGLIAAIDSGFLQNRVVIVCAPGVVAPDSVTALLEARFARVAIADPDLAPAGDYARAGLQRIGLWPHLQERLVFTANVRATLAAVATGAADAGFVYETDARTEPSLAVLRTDPDDPFPPAQYPLVLLKGAQPDAAALFDWVHTPAARDAARDLGFP